MAAADPEQERARAIALLEATHQFPVEYSLSVIARNLPEVVTAVRAAVGRDAYETVPSQGGRYASHRFRVPCQGPEDVLALYARLRGVQGVITVL